MGYDRLDAIERPVAVAGGGRAHSLCLLILAFRYRQHHRTCVRRHPRVAFVDGAKRRPAPFSETIEQRRPSQGSAGALLFAWRLLWSPLLALGVVANITKPELPPAGLILTIAANSNHVFSIEAKSLRCAGGLGSRALRADAFEGIACRWLSFTVVIGLLAQLHLVRGGSIPSRPSPSSTSWLRKASRHGKVRNATSACHDKSE